jgi:DNA-binding XRE family transcriptional regulator
MVSKGGEPVKSRLNVYRFKSNGERISQEDLASALGCSRDWIIKAEKGRLGRTAELMIRLSHVLGRDLREIFLLDEPIDIGKGGEGNGDST